MSPEPKKRPRRIPYTPEEVANIIAYKQRREQIRLDKFKKSATYKLQNVFNIFCFFVFWEIIFCFFGPASYQRHYAYKVEVQYGDRYDEKAHPVVSEINLYCVKGGIYKLVPDDFVEVPAKFAEFTIASDFLLHKNLKGSYGHSASIRLFSASPVLLIIMLALVTSFVGYFYNLNQNSYSLMAITVLNAISLFGIFLL
jgi:hypothetical protein